MPKASAAVIKHDSQAALMCGEAFQRLAEKLIPDIWKAKEGLSQGVPNEIGVIAVCATNLAFALELYLKGLLVRQSLPVPKTHDLQMLYGKIYQPFRAHIERIYDEALPDEVRRLGGRVSFTCSKGPPVVPEWNDNKASQGLPDLLARSKDQFSKGLFESWRYVFEFSQTDCSSQQFHKFEYVSLHCAAEALRVVLAISFDPIGKYPMPDFRPVLDC